MIVYGDPGFDADFPALLQRLHAHLAAPSLELLSLDEWRALLIEAGQLEQAALDDLCPQLPPERARETAAHLQSLTDAAARQFLSVWQTQNSPANERQPRDSQPRVALQGALQQLMEQRWPPLQLRVKVPEGFAFYALFPENYIVAARRWMEAPREKSPCEASPRRAVVLGLRSIGTTLSALVLATLRDGGWNAHRLTARPDGHPFERNLELEPGAVRGALYGLVVDEGPGMSGSSFAAGARALQRGGVAREKISFLPGHGAEPGRAASDETRESWRAAPRFVAAPNELRWKGRALHEVLGAQTPALCESSAPVARLEEFGGGAWRHAVYASERDWPAVCAPFERPKIRVTLRDGACVLWKFAGLSSAGQGDEAGAHLQTLRHRAALGLPVAPPLGAAMGFVATRWLEGAPLSRADASETIACQIGRFIARVAGPPAAAPEQRNNIGRLGEMLFWNVWELRGEDAAERTRFWTQRALQEPPSPRFGDGRLAPHQWLRQRDGRICKTGGTGRGTDHTIIGQQSAAWDVAGAFIEWSFDDAAQTALLRAFYAANGAPFSRDFLVFHQLAYAAFRAGQTALCAGTGDAAEAARLRGASDFYRDQLLRQLEES